MSNYVQKFENVLNESIDEIINEVSKINSLDDKAQVLREYERIIYGALDKISMQRVCTELKNMSSESPVSGERFDKLINEK